MTAGISLILEKRDRRRLQTLLGQPRERRTFLDAKIRQNDNAASPSIDFCHTLLVSRSPRMRIENCSDPQFSVASAPNR